MTEEDLQRRRKLYAFTLMCMVWIAFVLSQNMVIYSKHAAPLVVPKNKLDIVNIRDIGELQEIEKSIVTEKVNYEKKVVKEEVIQEEVALQEVQKVEEAQKAEVDKERGTYFLERKPAIEYNEEDLWYLANGIYSEAGICSDMECYRCGQVMLDRLLDRTGRFPQNTMKGILCASGQFGCVGGDAWKHGPTDRELKIARDLFEGARVFPEDIVWFNNSHDYGYLYCCPEYHYFSGYLDNGGKYASASSAKAVVQEEVVLEETIETIEAINAELTEVVEEPIAEQTEQSQEEIPTEEIKEVTTE